MNLLKNILLLSFCFIIFSCVNTLADTDQIHLIINGKNVEFDDSTGYPYIDENNRTLVPLRAAMEATGSAVGYDADKKTAVVVTEYYRIEIPVNTDYIYKENEKIENDTFSVITDGKIYLPVRIVLETADYELEWDKNTNTINAHNFHFDTANFVPYTADSPSILLDEMLKGTVIYIDGRYFVTPDYFKDLGVSHVNYPEDELNTAIYPQSERSSYDDLKSVDIEWVSGPPFGKLMVDANTYDGYFEEAEIPGFGYAYGFYDSKTLNYSIIYAVDEMTDEFMNAKNAYGTFNGIRMKKQNGILYFNYDDMVKLGLIEDIFN